MATEGLKVFTMKQVSAHTTKNDCWFVIGGKVYNVTKFLEEHPGGEEVLIEASGKDATRDFEDVGHSAAAKGMMDSYQVGVLEGFEGDVASVKETTTTTTNKQDKAPFKEIPAFVTKDDEPTSFTKLVQFLLPLLILGVAFGIRSFMKDSQPSQPSS
uniref:Cytochrome b5 heme-binding domain-containing protein n=1 Tax=Araucaria cunninghamii TaxID=56994 RepID=A0A0D6QYG1_ARACU